MQNHAVIIENRWNSWARVTGLVDSKAAIAQVAVLEAGSSIKSRLGLRSDPFQFRGSSHGIEFRASGLAGSLSLKEVSFEIAPKFVDDPASLPRWNSGTLFLLEALAGKYVMPLLASRQQWKPHRVVDLLAHAFADAAEQGLREQPIQIYQHREEASPVLRGRLNVSRQVRNIIHAPHQLECDVDQLDIENPFNDVLKWAATVLANSVRDPALKVRLGSIALALPGDIDRSLTHRHQRLVPPPQFRAWSNALDLARLLSSRMTLSGNGGKTVGYSLLFNMERAFERFVEVALAKALRSISDPQLSTSRQARTIYGKPAFPDGKSLYVQPDNLIRRNGAPTMVVDAKYKRLDREIMEGFGTSSSPISQDIYELVVGMAAHQCQSGLLIYPSTTQDKTINSTIRVWHLNIFEKSFHVGALPINLLNLTSRDEAAQLFKSLGSLIGQFSANLPVEPFELTTNQAQFGG